jgi:hypothetical protein
MIYVMMDRQRWVSRSGKYEEPRREPMLKRILPLFIVSCLILASTPTPSFGWGAGGHMMVAFIGFQRLNRHAKAEVSRLLAIPIDPASQTRKSRDFVTASIWADDVKRLPGFEFSGDLHFADFPFSVDGTPLPDLPKPENIIAALERYTNVLKTSRDPDEQAQALRFVIHFVGDIHQPLHCATRVDGKNPEGDAGGNFFFVKIPDKNGKLKRVKLHSYWDGGIDTFPKTGKNFAPPPLSQIPAAAATARNGNPATDPKLKLDKPFDFQGWADESKELARTFAYANLVNGGTRTTKYKTDAVRVARKRVACAGYRLAALLNAIWPEGSD